MTAFAAMTRNAACMRTTSLISSPLRRCAPLGRHPGFARPRGLRPQALAVDVDAAAVASALKVCAWSCGTWWSVTGRCMYTCGGGTHVGVRKRANTRSEGSPGTPSPPGADHGVRQLGKHALCQRSYVGLRLIWHDAPRGCDVLAGRKCKVAAPQFPFTIRT